jgi:hypothetical protein
MQLVKKLRAATAVIREKSRAFSRALPGRPSVGKGRAESNIALSHTRDHPAFGLSSSGGGEYGALGGGGTAAGDWDGGAATLASGGSGGGGSGGGGGGSVASSASTIGGERFFDIRFTEQRLGLWLREEGASVAEHSCIVEGYAEDMIAPGTSELSTRLLNVPLQGCWLFKKNKTLGYKCFFARIEGSALESALHLYSVASASEVDAGALEGREVPHRVFRIDGAEAVRNTSKVKKGRKGAKCVRVPSRWCQRRGGAARRSRSLPFVAASP